MKNIGFTIIIAIFTFGLTHHSPAGPAGFLTRHTQDWNFIQSVGGMKVVPGNNELLITCDVSGTTTVTTKPTTVNSGMGVRKLKASRKGNTIRLSLITSVLEKGMKTTCDPIKLTDYAPGTYHVVYFEPNGKSHALATITLPTK